MTSIAAWPPVINEIGGGEQRVTDLDGVTFADEYLADRARFGCAHCGLHFHRFDNKQRLPFFDVVAWRHVHLEDVAGKYRLHGLPC